MTALVSSPRAPAERSPLGHTGELLDELAAALEALAGEHGELLEVAKEHRAALGRGDGGAIDGCLRRQNIIVQRIAETEKRRIGVVAELADRLGEPRDARGAGEIGGGGGGGGPPTVSWLAARAPETHRHRLTALARSLRSAVEAVQREHAVIRIASESLAMHADALMRHVARALSQAGTYGRSGTIADLTPSPASLDLTT